MTLLYRRITYITFIIIFLILAPAAILYTQGFRYNFHYSRVQKTGIMIISSMPRRAQISLNGTVYDKDTTPTKVENMLPGDYEITLTKEGYHNGTKNCPSMKTTRLLPKTLFYGKMTIQSQSAKRLQLTG